MKILTAKGYDFFEASSALQKAIRRGDEPVALYFSVELYNSNYDEYVWKRIKIITSEDIGLAAPQLHAVIAALYKCYSEMKKEYKDGRPERLFIVHAIVQLCRAKKSRLLDWTMIKSWREHEFVNMAIPEYALDKHTLKGKQLGRGVDHFFNEGSFLNNHFEQEGEAEMKKLAMAAREKNPGKLVFKPREKNKQPDLFKPNPENEETANEQ